MSEKTLLVIKPDGIERGLTGEIISRILCSGLKISALKMARPDREFVEKFLDGSGDWIIGMGNKALSSFEKAGMDPAKTFKTNDPYEIGRMVKKWLIEFWLSGKVVAIVVSGADSIKKVRELIGNTVPADAKKGTIRGDYSRDTPIEAGTESRCLHNLVHASGDQKEAEREIDLWFQKNEIFD